MNFWEYLAERQRQKTIRRVAEKESKRIENILANNIPAVATQLLDATKESMKKYLDIVIEHPIT